MEEKKKKKTQNRKKRTSKKEIKKGFRHGERRRVRFSNISFNVLRTYPFQLLEVLSEESDWVFRPGDAQLDNAVLEDLLNGVTLDIVLALTQGLVVLIAPGRAGTGKLERIHLKQSLLTLTRFAAR